MKNPNRLVAVALAVCGFAAAVLPVAANLDWTSTAGVLGGLGAVAAAAVTWLLGWQKWEASQLAGSASSVSSAPDSAEHELAASTIVAEPFKGKVPPDKGDARAVRKTRLSKP